MTVPQTTESVSTQSDNPAGVVLTDIAAQKVKALQAQV